MNDREQKKKSNKQKRTRRTKSRAQQSARNNFTKSDLCLLSCLLSVKSVCIAHKHNYIYTYIILCFSLSLAISFILLFRLKRDRHDDTSCQTKAAYFNTETCFVQTICSMYNANSMFIDSVKFHSFKRRKRQPAIWTSGGFM